MRYVIIIEKGESRFGAYVPDLPGCVAVSESEVEVAALIQESIEFHLEGMRAEGLTIPEPVSSSPLVEIAA